MKIRKNLNKRKIYDLRKKKKAFKAEKSSQHTLHISINYVTPMLKTANLESKFSYQMNVTM